MARKSKAAEGTITVNKWPATCCKCGCAVKPWKGWSVVEGTWKNYCLPCFNQRTKPAPVPQQVHKPFVPSVANCKKSHTEFFYTSWGDFMAQANAPSHLNDYGRSSRDVVDNPRWSGTNNWQQAVDLATRGWPDGWSKVKEIASQIGEAVASKTTTVETAMAESGDELDVPLLLTGEPECWYNYPLVEHKAQGGRIVRIGVNMSISGGISVDSIINRGAAALAVLDALESHGYRVELVVMDSVYNNDPDDVCTVSVKMKESDQPIDIDRLAFAVVHPAMQRRVLFSVEETLGDAIVARFGFRRSDAYGVPCPYPKSSEFDVYFDKLHLDGPWQSLEGATSQALDALTKTGLLQMRAEAV